MKKLKKTRGTHSLEDHDSDLGIVIFAGILCVIVVLGVIVYTTIQI